MNHLQPKDNSSVAYHALRISLGLIYFHFGFLKFLPGVSPAETLAGDTISAMTLGLLDPTTSVFLLAILECGLGVLLLINVVPRVAYFIFLGHMAGTFMPFILLPHITFQQSILTPTLEGQYILKNIVFVVAISAVFVPQLFPAGDWIHGMSKMIPRFFSRLGDVEITPQIETSNLIADDR